MARTWKSCDCCEAIQVDENVGGGHALPSVLGGDEEPLAARTEGQSLWHIVAHSEAPDGQVTIGIYFSNPARVTIQHGSVEVPFIVGKHHSVGSTAPWPLRPAEGNVPPSSCGWFDDEDASVLISVW